MDIRVKSFKMKYRMWIIVSIVGVLVVSSVAAFSHPALGRLPRGERLERIKKSVNYRDGQFHNQSPTPTMTSEKSRWRAMIDFVTTKKPKNLVPDVPIKAVKTDLSTLDLTKDQIVWFGHSSYLLVISGKTFLVDPVFAVSFPASLMMKPFLGTDIYSPDDMPNVDYLIITHDHYDHLDYKTVKAIRERVGRVVCPLGVGEHLEYWGYEAGKIVELDWKEVFRADDLTITCLPTRHFSGRFLKQNPTLWASFMVECGRTVFVGGDGGYDNHFAAIGQRFPNIDLAVLENGQYNVDWKYIHSMPTDLVQEIKELGAKVVQPVHNSKFALARHPWDEPIENIHSAAAADSCIRLLDATIGVPTEF